MDLGSGLLVVGASVSGTLLTYAIPFLFVLTLVVFFHELGHFLVARWCGVTVEVFSIGFGRAIVSWVDKKGTHWKIGWLPLGGYVKFLGDEGVASMPKRDATDAVEGAARDSAHIAGNFHLKPLAKRAAIVAAGPVANFLLAITIFAGLFMITGEEHVPAKVASVMPDSAAAAAGFQPGDVVIGIDGRGVENFGRLREIVGMSPGRDLAIEVRRDGRSQVLHAVPDTIEETDRFGNVYQIGRLGIASDALPEDIEIVRYGPVSAVWKAVVRTGFIVERTMEYIGELFVGRQDASQLSGPLGIAKVSGEMAQLGLTNLIYLAAVLSVSIGLVNLFPIPLLDGGHLLYYGFEAVRGRPLGDRAQEMGFRIGLAFVICLMVFVTWNDLVKLRIFG